MIQRAHCIGLSIIFFVMFSGVTDLLAQDKDFDPWADNSRNREKKIRLGTKGTFGRLQLGNSFLNISDMNFVLENLDYEPLNSSYFAMGLGMTRMSGKWLLSGDLYNYMIQESAFNNQLAILSFHYLTTSVGYLAFRKENEYLVYPSVGIGGGITNLKIRKSDERQHTPYFSSGALADFALNVRRLTQIEDENGYALEVGLSLGYLYAIGDQFNFRNLVPDQTVSASPSGFYFRLSLGMGKLK